MSKSKTTLHEDIFRDSKGNPVHDGDEHVQVVYRYCASEGCEAKLIVWTQNMKDNEGNPVAKPTSEDEVTHGASVCVAHGFDALLGR